MTLCSAGLPNLGDCPAKGTGDLGEVAGGRWPLPIASARASYITGAGHCWGTGVALPRQSPCGSRGGRGRCGGEQVWTDSSVTTSRPQDDSGGVSVHIFNWFKKSMPLWCQGQEGQDGTGSTCAALPQPGSAQDLAHIKLRFGLTRHCLALCAIALAKPWQLCPPVPARTMKLALRGQPALWPPSLQQLPVLQGVSLHTYVCPGGWGVLWGSSVPCCLPPWTPGGGGLYNTVTRTC